MGKETDAAQPGARENGRENGRSFGSRFAGVWKIARWFVFALLLAPVVYIAIQVFIVMAPRIRTQVAIGDVMTESVSAMGIVSLDSQPLVGGSGALYYTVPPGQRVSAGAEVALVFPGRAGAQAQDRLVAVERELALLNEAAATTGDAGNVDGFLKQVDEGVFRYRAQLEQGDFAAMQDAKDAVALAENKVQAVTDPACDFSARIAALEAERAALEGQAVPSGALTATATGFFAPAARFDRQVPDIATLEALSPLELQGAIGAEPVYYDESVSGHITTDYVWRLFTVLPLAQAEKFAVGGKVEISFPEVAEGAVPAVVENVQPDEENNIVKITLVCENMNPSILGLRVERAQIVFQQQKGLRIDKSALRIIEGEKYVYVKFGNQVFLRHVDVLLDDGHYLLVPDKYEEGVNEVQMYDEVVVETGGTELYDQKIL